RPGWNRLVLLALTITLLLLTRQIGLFLLGFCVIALAVLSWLPHTGRPPRTAPLALLILTALLIAPYVLALYLQTGVDPLTQRFATTEPRQYTPTPSDIARIEAIRQIPARTYEDGLLVRREVRQLNEDGSRMLSGISTSDTPPEPRAHLVTRTLNRLLDSPEVYKARLQGNLAHLTEAIGQPLTVLYGLALGSVLLSLRRGASVLRQALPGLYALFYLLLLSLLVGSVDRYTHVVLPFVLIFIPLECHRRLRQPDSATIRRAAPWLTAALAALAIVLLPLRYTHADLHPKIPESAIPITAFRSTVPRGAPVLAIHPYYAYLAGGTWRVLPNDRLAQVVRYARRHGIKWLLVARSVNDLPELQRYRHSPWLRDRALPWRHGGLLELEQAVYGGQFALYRLRDRDRPAGNGESEL
ncbi:MAG: hypothetical protein R3202_13755, partial [Candidatus Competibacterales bacterium]|nr:hypothetical protein [Candidatus Competibacterales bacterium]